MDPNLVQALVRLNLAFYDKFAGDFARTRRSSPPGFDRIVPYLSTAANVVDLGCGNGRLLAYLAGQGWTGRYIGLDSSAGLLENARQAAQAAAGVEAVLLETELMDPQWPVDPAALQPGDAIASLAVLHHIPGRDNRMSFLAHAASLLPRGGHLVLSTWQFLTSKRLRARLLDWDAAGLDAAQLEPGDFLMSWGAGAAGQRYVAAIDAPELLALAAEAKLKPVEVFTTDGLEGDLNLYGVFSAR